MDDFERSELADLAIAYRNLYAAILERAFEDLHMLRYAEDARKFFESGRANPYILLIDLDPTSFIRNVLSAPRRRPPSSRIDNTETGDEVWLP